MAIAQGDQSGNDRLHRAAGAAPGKQAGMQWDRWAQPGLDDQLQGMAPVEFVLRFTFSHPDMDTTIPPRDDNPVAEVDGAFLP